MEDSLPTKPIQSRIETVDPKLSFPSREELNSIEYQKLGAFFLENNRKLLALVRSLGTANIPYFGLHGLKKADDLRSMLNMEKPYFQIVTVFEKPQDPVVALNDLYDVVGGDAYYFKLQPEAAFIVFNLEKDGNKSLARKWGERGEPKGWGIAPQGYSSGIVNKDFFKNQMGLDVSSEDSKFFEYFQGTGRYMGDISHAQKSDLVVSGKEAEARIMGFFPTSVTDFYLLADTLDSSSPEFIVRKVLQEMLYIQSILEKLLDIFKRKHS